MRLMPSVGSGRYSPGPGMVRLLGEKGLLGITHGNDSLFTEFARFPYYRLGFSGNNYGPSSVPHPSGFIVGRFFLDRGVSPAGSACTPRAPARAGAARPSTTPSGS